MTGERAPISEGGIEVAGDGFVTVSCSCGAQLGPAPDRETILDWAMEHAWLHGRALRDGEAVEHLRQIVHGPAGAEAIDAARDWLERTAR